MRVLTEIYPKDYLPQLANLVERASKEELMQVTGEYRGTRRILVWLAQRMAAFPEFFSYAELILWKLALTETELNIANNGTHIWQQLFGIFLSGTAVPFSERIDLLEKRLFTHEQEQIDLALQGLKQAFKIRDSRIIGSPLIAGRISPKNWQPQTQLELEECFNKALTILLKAAKSDISNLQTGALNIAIECTPTLIASGYLKQVKALFSADTLSQEILVALIRRLEKFLELNSDASSEVKQWLQSLIPNDFHGKLIQIVGKSPWSYSFRDNEKAWEEELNSLARQLYQDRELFKSQMQWLSSPQAIMVEDLGSIIGQYDADADCLDMIMESVAKTQATGLARGYIASLLRNHSQHNVVVNQWIDKFEIQAPTVAYELFRSGGNITKAVERALKLVDQGSLNLEYLGGFFPRLLATEEFYEILKRLLTSVRNGDESVTKTATKTAIELITNRLAIERNESNTSILEESKVQDLIWDFLKVTAQSIRFDSYKWEEIFTTVAKFDVNKAVKIASLAILSQNEQQKMRAEEFLINLAESDPNLVMQNLGEIILDNKYGWHFEIEKYRFLIQNLPLDAIKQWLCSVGGVIGARRISRQLSLPYLDENNQPIVPRLTEFILSEFEDDEDTFNNFCIGSHSLQVYVGDLASYKNKEAEIARNFLNHPLRRVKEWARYEINNCQKDAKYWLQIEEERKI